MVSNSLHGKKSLSLRDVKKPRTSANSNNTGKRPQNQVNQVVSDDEDDDDEVFFVQRNRRVININSIGNQEKSCPTIDLNILNTNIEFVIDTGATLNLISRSAYKMSDKPVLSTCNKK